MSIEEGRKFFRAMGVEYRILEFDESCATVEEAAHAVGVEPARICKTLSFKTEDDCMLVLTSGDTKIDNRKFKDKFGIKAKMLNPDEVLELVGHPVGGVCPFGIRNDIPVYLDESLKRFEIVYPSVGSPNSAIPLDMQEIFAYSRGLEWVDVCKPMEAKTEDGSDT